MRYCVQDLMDRCKLGSKCPKKHFTKSSLRRAKRDEYSTILCRLGKYCRDSYCPFAHSTLDQETAKDKIRNIQCPFFPCVVTGSRRCPYYHKGDSSKRHSHVSQNKNRSGNATSNRGRISTSSTSSHSYSSGLDVRKRLEPRSSRSSNKLNDRTSRKRPSIRTDGTERGQDRDSKKHRNTTASSSTINGERRNDEAAHSIVGDSSAKAGVNADMKISPAQNKTKSSGENRAELKDVHVSDNKDFFIRQILSFIKEEGEPLFPPYSHVQIITLDKLRDVCKTYPELKRSINAAGGLEKLLYFSSRVKCFTSPTGRQHFAALMDAASLNIWKIVEKRLRSHYDIDSKSYGKKSGPALKSGLAVSQRGSSNPMTTMNMNSVNNSSKRNISQEELNLRKGIVILDLDNALIHFMNKKDFPEAAGLISDEVIEVGENYKLALRCGAKTLVKAVKKLGLNIHIVTQNLEGDNIVSALMKSDKKVWYGIPVHVVHKREARSKRLVDIIKTKENIPIDRIRSWTIILDDQEKSWTNEDVSQVIRLRKYDILAPINGKKKLLQEKHYLTSILLQIMEFAADRMSEERKEYYDVVR